MDQEGLKLRLINIIDSGLNARAIAKKININSHDNINSQKNCTK